MPSSLLKIKIILIKFHPSFILTSHIPVTQFSVAISVLSRTCKWQPQGLPNSLFLPFTEYKHKEIDLFLHCLQAIFSTCIFNNEESALAQYYVASAAESFPTFIVRLSFGYEGSWQSRAFSHIYVTFPISFIFVYRSRTAWSCRWRHCGASKSQELLTI